MKRIVTIAVILFFGMSSGQAQISDGFRLGLSANPLVTFLGSNDPTIQKSGSNVGFGLMLDGEVYFGSDGISDKNYAITTGLGIVFNQGGKLNHQYGGNLWTSGSLKPPLTDSTGAVVKLPDGATLGYKLQTVRVPFGLKLRTNEIGYMRYFGQVPFMLDVTTAARGTVKDAGEFNTENKQTINDDVKKLNLSWGIGGGIEYEIATGTSLTAGLFFHGGFLDMTKDKGMQDLPNGTVNENSKTVINSVSLKVGVLF